MRPIDINLAIQCDLCSMRFHKGDKIIDGKTKMGSWATMCINCLLTYGVGLGTGKGQKFIKT